MPSMSVRSHLGQRERLPWPLHQTVPWRDGRGLLYPVPFDVMRESGSVPYQLGLILMFSSTAHAFRFPQRCQHKCRRPKPQHSTFIAMGFLWHFESKLRIFVHNGFWASHRNDQLLRCCRLASSDTHCSVTAALPPLRRRHSHT